MSNIDDLDIQLDSLFIFLPQQRDRLSDIFLRSMALCKNVNISLVASALFFSVFGILLTTTSTSTFVQTSDAAMYRVTSGGSLNVILQPSPFPVIKGSQTNLKVSFHQKGSSALQAHVDYDLTIMKDGKQVFQLSSQAGYPNQPLHTTEGVVIIPYTFQQAGTYVINITVYGILYNPITPETSQFTINVN